MAIFRQKELARLAGVSQATVSRCLRNDASQHPGTRKRIFKLAKKMGYVPNSLAAGLAQARFQESKSFRANLAMIGGNKEVDPVRTWKAWQLSYEAARGQAEQHGYTLEYFWRYAPGLSAARLRDMIEARGIMGAVLLMIDPTELNLPWDTLALSSVCVSNSVPSRAHYVGFDRYLHLLNTFETFEKIGYRRPALAFYQPSELAWDRGANTAAFRFYQERLVAGDRLPIYVGSSENFPSWYEAYRPDIIFSFSGGIVKEIRHWIPRQTGFVNLTGVDYGDIPGCSFLDPRTDLAGIAAVDLVTAQLQRNERGWPSHPNCTLVPSQIQFGTTTHRQPKRIVRVGRQALP